MSEPSPCSVEPVFLAAASLGICSRTVSLCEPQALKVPLWGIQQRSISDYHGNTAGSVITMHHRMKTIIVSRKARNAIIATSDPGPV